LSVGLNSFRWTGKCVLVTGAAGFLGQHLVEALLRQGAMVFASSRRNRLPSPSESTWLLSDLSDVDEVKATIRRVRPHVIFHLSSLADGRRDMSLVLPTLRAEVLSTVNILIAAVDAKVERLVLPGSLEEPAASSAPSSPYAAAKLTSRNYARMFNVLYDVPVVVPRLYMCYGPGQPDWKIIPHTIRCLLAGQQPVVASPDRAVDWIYVTDAVDGLIASVAASMLEGESIDIGSGNLVKIRDVVEKLRALINPRIEADYSRTAPRAHEQERRADIETTFMRTNWRPVVSLDEGLRKTVLNFTHLPGKL